MEISIWFAHQVISNIMRFFSYLIPASNFESRITVSFYLQSASNILCIFLFRRYLCHFSDKKEISIKKLRICLWGVLAGIGVASLRTVSAADAAGIGGEFLQLE